MFLPIRTGSGLEMRSQSTGALCDQIDGASRLCGVVSVFETLQAWTVKDTKGALRCLQFHPAIACGRNRKHKEMAQSDKNFLWSDFDPPCFRSKCEEEKLNVSRWNHQERQWKFFPCETRWDFSRKQLMLKSCRWVLVSPLKTRTSGLRNLGLGPEDH